MTNASWRRQAVVFIAIAVALVGVLPFANPGCQNLFVLDSETGELRPATTEEVTQIVERVGDVARIGVVAMGRPEWLVFVDIGVRVVALAVGFLYGRKELSAKTVTQLAATPARSPPV